MATKKHKYDVFISYSQSGDSLLAQVIEKGLRTLGKPWNKLEALRVFRDTSNLSVSATLWPSIQKALLDSNYFLLIASPHSAKSKWVGAELEFWLNNKPKGTLMIALSNGKIIWDKEAKDFDWSNTTALSSMLKAQFNHEPKFANFTRIGPSKLTLENKTFAQEIATISAHVQGVTPDDIIGEEKKQYRIFKVVQVIISTIIVLLIGYVGFLIRQSIIQSEGNEIAIKGVKYEDINPTIAYQQVLLGYKHSKDSTLIELAANIYNRNHTYKEQQTWNNIHKCACNKNTLLCIDKSNQVLIRASDKSQKILNLVAHLNTKEVVNLTLNASSNLFLVTTDSSSFIFNTNGDLIQKYDTPFAIFSYHSNDLFVLFAQNKIQKLNHQSNYDSRYPTQQINLSSNELKPFRFALSGNDSIIMISDSSGYKTYNLSTGKIIVHKNTKVIPSAISLTGKYVAEIDYLVVKVFQGDSLIQVMRDHTDNINNIQFSPKVERILLSSARDKLSYIHEVGTTRPVATLIAHMDDPEIYMGNDGQSFISYDRSNIFFWDMIGAPIIVYFENSTSQFNSVKVAPHTHSVAAATMDGILFVWDSSGSIIFHDSITSYFSKNRMAFDSSGEQLFYISTSGNSIQMSNFKAKSKFVEISDAAEILQCIGLLKNGDLVGITISGTFYKWNSTGKEIIKKKIIPETSSILSLQTTSKNILLGSDDGLAYLFDLDGTLLRKIKFDSEGTNIQAADISSSSEYLAIGGNNGNLRLYQNATDQFKEKRVNISRASYIMDVLLLNRTPVLLTCGSDRSLKLWDLDGRLVSSIKTNTDFIIWDMDTTDDETQVVTGDDHSVKKWLIKSPIKLLDKISGINSQ